MIDSVIRRPQRRPQHMVNYRPDESVVYARRVLRVSDEGRSRESLEKLRDIPVPVTPLEVLEEKYRAHDIDDVFAKITQIEAEGSTVGQPLAPFARGSLVALPIIDSVRSWRVVSPEMARLIAHQTARLVDRAAAFAPRFRSLSPRIVMAATAAAVIMAFTGYISIDTLVTNNQVKQAMTDQPDQAVAGASDTRSAIVLGEGRDESDVHPATIDSYAVAPDLPRVLSIDKLNLKARVLPMSVNADGSLQAPVNIFDSGWYGASAKPGTPGAMFIDAHASGATRQGLFAYLDTLKVGDQISVERGDRQTFTYEVAKVDIVPLDAVDMSDALQVYGGAAEGLNLMTCTGKWLPEKKTYDHRVIVYTQRI